MSPRDSVPRLGRGLAALLGDVPGATDHGDGGVRSLPVESLEPGPYQPRQTPDADSLKELADSVRARGILQPLLARPHPRHPGRYQIVAGERRWRAAQLAGLHDIPVLVRPLLDAEALAAALVENLQRQDLNAVEEAEGYRRLIDEFAMTQEALGDAVGKSRSHVANTLRLLNLPPTVLGEVRNGALSAGHAWALLAHPQPEKAALAVIARGLNVRQTEALAAREGTRPPDPAGDRGERAPETVALERMLSERLGLKVDVNFDGKSGALRIYYRSLEQLDGLVTLLTRD